MAGGQLQQFAGHPHLMVPGVPPQVVPPAMHRHVRRDAARRVVGEEVREHVFTRSTDVLSFKGGLWPM